MTIYRNDNSVGVIVPYFQRQPGLLARALRSIFLQIGAQAETIIVIDDGSPAPGVDELSGFSEAERMRVTLIKQQNTGVSAARNRGLVAMPASIDIIAFLDSDDHWTPGHLSNALLAIRQGADFYFSDHCREGATKTRFSECNIIPNPAVQLPQCHDTYWFCEDFFAALLQKSPVGTSTVVFRRSVAPDLRFHDGLSQREDALFWMLLAQIGIKVAFCTDIGTEYGTGVNIFASATWGTPKVLNMLLNVAIFHCLADNLFALSPDLRAWNNTWLRQVRRDFALNLVHLIRNPVGVDWHSVRRFIRLDPRVIAAVAMVPVIKIRNMAAH